MVRNLPAMRETCVQSLGQDYTLEKGMATITVFLPGEFHGKRSLGGYSSWCLKELDMTEQLSLSSSCDNTVGEIPPKHYFYRITLSNFCVFLLHK